MAWSTLDLSSVTDELKSLLNGAVAEGSPMWRTPDGMGGPIDFFGITVSGAMPAADREESGCVLNLYLLHVSQDKNYRNTPVAGARAQENRHQPLALDLYYLLTAYANKNYNQEQQAMSIAMRTFHESAIVLNAGLHEYTITMEAETVDDMSRIWQALSTPLRLAVIYKVSVVFVTPSQAPSAPGPRPVAVGLVVAPQDHRAGPPARLFSAAVRQSVMPRVDGAGVETLRPQIVPGLVRPGDVLIVSGDGLDLAGYHQVYLSGAGGAEWDVTDWSKGTDSHISGLEMRLRLPPLVAAAADGTHSPLPGVYLLSVGSAGLRSPAIPVMVAARIGHFPATGPLEPDAAGLFTFDGTLFIKDATDLTVGDATLNEVGAAPAEGEFEIAADGGSIGFRPPADLAPGRHDLGVRVNGVTSPPAWYIEIVAP